MASQLERETQTTTAVASTTTSRVQFFLVDGPFGL